MRSDRVDVQEAQTQTEYLVIGIGGGSGAGKSVVTAAIKEELGEVLCAHLYEDHYYLNQSHIPFPERIDKDYDDPKQIEFSLLAKHIKSLISGESVDGPLYDFTIHSRKTETIRLVPKRIILVEGILALHAPELAHLLNLRIFVNTDPDQRKQRRLAQDVNQRGRTLEQAERQYATTVLPAFDRYVAPSMRSAQIIVTNNSDAPALDFDMRELIAVLRQRIQNLGQSPSRLASPPSCVSLFPKLSRPEPTADAPRAPSPGVR